MIRSIIQYIKLAGLILKRGKLYAFGIDFNQRRAENLRELQEFVPPALRTPEDIISRKTEQTVFNNIYGQAAFIKNAFRLKGGHLRSASLKLAYIRLPKSASTSMSLTMLETIYPALKSKAITEQQINFLADINLENSIEQNTADTFFTIVRNPFERLVSVYHDFFETDKSEFIYSNYLFGVLTPFLTFSEFIDRIENIPDSLKDQHLKSQSSFLLYYKRKNIDVTILKLEESEKVNSFLSSYSLELTHRNKSVKPYLYKDYYSKVTLQKVFKMYQTDIEMFGYQDVYKTLLEYTKSGKNT